MQSCWEFGSRIYLNLSAVICEPFVQRRSSSSSTSFSSSVAARIVLLFSLVLFLGSFISYLWINATLVAIAPIQDLATTPNNINSQRPHKIPLPPPIIPPPPPPSRPKPQLIPFSCTASNRTTHFCPSPAAPSHSPPAARDDGSAQLCPDYFRWIHEDLKPWNSTGITREMVERARKTANFRLVVLDGRVYVQKYRRAFQTRDVFTLWGILQLLRRYPGRLPDLDLMFDCVDWPVVKAASYRGINAPAPPPLFRYCGDDHTLDIVFPDWSFWGWPEINIKPWEHLLRELKEGNQQVKWMDREPHAYWKGNPWVATKRQNLLKCNVSDTHDWNARVYTQDWLRETKQGFKQSNLSSQCIHRYKIYIEGTAWSVSQKNILACDSTVLVVTPRYYDFFTRGLMPVHHYWPIKEDNMCRSIKFAVDWGNSHKQKAQEIGRRSSSFIQEKLRMDDVYDYMFHLLNEYAKLLRYKPTKPRKGVEWCSESMVCPAKGLEKEFMMESMVNVPQGSGPCTLPPFNPVEMKLLLRRKSNSVRQDWLRETKQGFKQSNLASQCIHRYKIYIEGTAWSVSQKNILACDSTVLVVTPRYYDFFTRGLMPVYHYWPIKEDNMCRSIKFAVDWGNSHKQKAHEIGRRSSSFIQEKLRMDDVYDYMFHLLNEYAKLLRYKPTKPRKGVEWCSESMVCPAKGLEKEFMMESMVNVPQGSGPCTLPPPFNPVEMKLLLRRKSNSVRQDWLRETKQGFKQSNLSSQCIHRYKIYIEGTAWSVSQKNILACDSTVLVVTPRYYDFFTRGLMPVHHYWPIKEDNMCRSIKFAVDWGNSHKQKAQEIGRRSSSFIQEKLRMDDVYDYMFHLLNEYAKLLRYKPTKPRKGVEWCSESMVCPAKGLEKEFMMESMVNVPQGSGPCTLPPAFNPVEMKLLLRRKSNSVRQVELWEQRA